MIAESVIPFRPKMGRPPRESVAEMELQVCRDEITHFIDHATPALDALQAATLELGPLAFQHCARIRYEMERLSVREYGEAA